jgi:hypothetical protein
MKIILKNETQQLNNEDEYLAMNSGAFSPEFLARIKRSKANNNENKRRERRAKQI